MIKNSLLPNIKDQTTKSKIMSILAYKFPLSVNDLKKQIKKNYSKNVSYQGIHKILIELMEQEVVVKRNKEYLLNIDWLKNINVFSKKIWENYSKVNMYSVNLVKELKNEGDNLTLEFNTIRELDRFLLDFMESFDSVLNEDDKIVMHYTHNWWALVYGYKEYEINNKPLTKNRFYCICGSDLPIDKWCCDFENNIGMNVKYSNNATLNWHLNIFGDFVIQFHMDKKISKKLHNYFENTKTIKNLDLTVLLKILNLKGNFKITITKNTALSAQVIKSAMALFRNN